MMIKLVCACFAIGFTALLIGEIKVGVAHGGHGRYVRVDNPLIYWMVCAGHAVAIGAAIYGFFTVNSLSKD